MCFYTGWSCAQARYIATVCAGREGTGLPGAWVTVSVLSVLGMIHSHTPATNTLLALWQIKKTQHTDTVFGRMADAGRPIQFVFLLGPSVYL